MIKRQLFLLLLFIAIFTYEGRSQTAPSQDEIIRLVIEQKKATDSKDALPFTLAPGRAPKTYLGHYTSFYNTECIVVCPLQQGSNFIQCVLLLYKNNNGYWQNGCWYYNNVYRLKVKDLNKDMVQEIILETKTNAGGREFGNYKIISLLDQKQQIWYDNNTILGIDNIALKNIQKGSEVTKDIKITFVDSSNVIPATIKERTIIGRYNSYTDSLGAKIDYQTIYQEYNFRDFRYIPKID